MDYKYVYIGTSKACREDSRLCDERGQCLIVPVLISTISHGRVDIVFSGTKGNLGHTGEQRHYLLQVLPEKQIIQKKTKLTIKCLFSVKKEEKIFF